MNFTTTGYFNFISAKVPYHDIEALHMVDDKAKKGGRESLVTRMLRAM